MFPPDWQCPTLECLNHVKMVFAKKEKCPICGASRPSSFIGTSGSDFRRFHPARSEVSRGRETRDDREYMVRLLVEPPVGGNPPSSFQVGISGSHDVLQAETHHLLPPQEMTSAGFDGRSDGVVALEEVGPAFCASPVESIHDSSFSPSDPISDFSVGNDPWLCALARQGRLILDAKIDNDEGGGESEPCPVPFSVGDQVYAPLTLAQCVHLILVGPPFGEESRCFVAHPGFGFSCYFYRAWSRCHCGPGCVAFSLCLLPEKLHSMPGLFHEFHAGLLERDIAFGSLA